MAQVENIKQILSKSKFPLYEKEWKETDDYQNYLFLNNLFFNKDTSLTERCLAIAAIYGGVQHITIPAIIKHFSKIDNLHNRLIQGDKTLVNEMSRINGINLYVFSRMFCHHSNPGAFFGYSSKVSNALVMINDIDSFYGENLRVNNFEPYEVFDCAMKRFVVHYGLEELNKTQLDILLKKINDIVSEKKEGGAK